MLARFLADPQKVRVGIRRLECGDWLATVAMKGPRHPSARVTMTELSSVAPTPDAAVLIALQRAAQHIPGIDLECWSAYEHPQHP